MEEKLTGRVNISDCDPEAFKVFLIFLYSGSVDFTKCNICELYKITDKYDVSELKLMCKDFITKNLSLKNFCEILVLCDQFNDAELLIEIQSYFRENFAKVVSSENWELLLENNFRPANNLLKQMAPRIKIVWYFYFFKLEFLILYFRVAVHIRIGELYTLYRVQCIYSVVQYSVLHSVLRHLLWKNF